MHVSNGTDNLNVIQTKINQIAKQKMDKDFKDMYEAINRMPLLSPMGAKTTDQMQYPNLATVTPNTGTPVSCGSGTNITSHLMSSNIDSQYVTKLKAFWLPVYIERETEAFLKKVENTTSLLDS